jgi:hypothetical protein
MDYRTYPNQIGHKPGEADRGVVRTGMVEENEDTKDRGLADYFAAVTHEANGEVRFYVFTATPSDSKFPNIPLWKGPYTSLSEEILTIAENETTEEELRYHPTGMNTEDNSLKLFEDFLNRDEGA